MVEKQIVVDLVEKLKSDIKKELNQKNEEMALQLIYSCALILQTNIYYVDEEIEADLKTVADNMSLAHPEQFKADTLLFYDGFGLNDRGLAQIYLNALCKLRNVVYVTYEDRKSDIPDLMRIINGGINCKAVFIKRNRCGFKEQIVALNDVIFAEQPYEFFFYSTPDDVVGTVVMNSYQGLIRRYQINLTDHAFWLGARCIDKCIEFRDYGASVSKKYRSIDEKSIVKLPFYPQTHPEREFQGYPFKKIEGQKVVFSGGGLYKTLGDDNKYYKIVDHILSNYKDVIFWYAGSGDDRELKKILNKFPERAYYTAERSDLFQVLQHSYFYLSTYPMCGGLMYQFATSAGKIPITLKYDDMTDGFLINQENLGIEFDGLDALYEEVDRLINDNKYYENKSGKMKNAVISEVDFLNHLNRILNDDVKDQFDIKYKDIQTERFRNEYLYRLENKDIDSMLANIRTLKSSIKYTPVRFIRGGWRKLRKKLCEISAVVLTYIHTGML